MDVCKKSFNTFNILLQTETPCCPGEHPLQFTYVYSYFVKPQVHSRMKDKRPRQMNENCRENSTQKNMLSTCSRSLQSIQWSSSGMSTDISKCLVVVGRDFLWKRWNELQSFKKRSTFISSRRESSPFGRTRATWRAASGFFDSKRLEDWAIIWLPE